MDSINITIHQISYDPTLYCYLTYHNTLLSQCEIPPCVSFKVQLYFLIKYFLSSHLTRLELITLRITLFMLWSCTYKSSLLDILVVSPCVTTQVLKLVGSSNHSVPKWVRPKGYVAILLPYVHDTVLGKKPKHECRIELKRVYILHD